MDIDSLLGIDNDNPLDRHADDIVSADEQLIRDLVARRIDLGLTQQDVADRMGINKSNVSRIERGARDLLQSTLRRYIMAVEAVVAHEVRDVEELDSLRRAGGYSPRHAVAYDSIVTSRPSRRLISRASGSPTHWKVEQISGSWR